MYNNVKLAPLKGSTKEEMSNVQLKSLTELFLTDPSIPRYDDLNHKELNFEHNDERSEANTASTIKDDGDSNNGSRSSIRSKSKRMNTRSSPRFSENSTSIGINSNHDPLALGVSDVNCLWKVYLNQQQKLGDISDKQAIAKSYHSLRADQIQALKDLYEKNTNLNKYAMMPSNQSNREKKSNKKKIGAPRKTQTSMKILPKSVNKRQQRKKRIRDELKRQLSTFTTLSETEGFPWKAIVSKSGFQGLKLVGWPRVIPRLKRIDDFNPDELNLFEKGLEKGSIKIVEKKSESF